MSLDRGIELYLEMMSLEEPISAIVTNRVLARAESNTPRGVVVRGRRFEDVFRDDQKRGGGRKRR